mmetsp:Transcript_125400/g.244202  ORF Transcript_125400/g.244202 Transcript_125400/m.244202 type:complete len:292 (-) Transcript_125400:438-1313(-)
MEKPGLLPNSDIRIDLACDNAGDGADTVRSRASNSVAACEWSASKCSNAGNNGIHTALSRGPSRCSSSRSSAAATATCPLLVPAIVASVKRQVRQRSFAATKCENNVKTASISLCTGEAAPCGHWGVTLSWSCGCGSHTQRHVQSVMRRPWSSAMPCSNGLSNAAFTALPRGQSICCKSDEWRIGSRQTCSSNIVSVQASPSGLPRRSNSCRINMRQGTLSGCGASGSAIHLAQQVLRRCLSCGREEGESSHILQSQALAGDAATRRRSDCPDALSNTLCSIAPSCSALIL